MPTDHIDARNWRGPKPVWPETGAVVTLTCRSAVDDLSRFASSKKVGPLRRHCTGLLRIQIAQANKTETSKLQLNPLRVGGHRSDHGPPQPDGMISDKTPSESKNASEALVGSADLRPPLQAKRRLAATTPGTDGLGLSR